jgi:UDP-N-acetylmuramyl pentapeptide phosphotransferase/UDP-N-acetylglucosamine-1-phosphate transferase
VKQTGGQIRTGERVVLFAGISAGLLLALGTGFLAPIFLLLATLLFSVWMVRQALGRVWTLTMIVALVAAIMFKGVIDDFRKIERQNPVALSAAARAGLMWTLLESRA